MFNFGDPSTPLFARLFDRVAQTDPNSAYALDNAGKKKAMRQGLLQLAAAMSKPNGGNFANSLATGLLAGSNSVNDAQSQYSNDAYRNDVMKRTQAEMAANTQKTQAWQHLYAPDGTIDPQGEAALRQADPQGYLDNAYKLHPEARPVHWQMGQVGDGRGGTIDVMYDPENPQGTLRTIDGKPLGGAPQSAPMQNAPQGGDLASAVQSVESGGNPNAVSPKGALGLMQTMPGTLRDPGYGVQPARDNSPQEQARVGQDYLGALTGKYGTYGGLAAYNWGPGNWEASLQKYGSPEAALAHAPAETRAYVPKVLARVGGAPSMGGGIGTRPAKGEQSTVDKRRQDIADLRAGGYQVTPEMEKGYVFTGKMPGSSDDEDPIASLTPAQRTIANAISRYDDLPTSVSYKDRTAVMGAVHAINPNYSDADSKEAYTFKKDLGRSSPTSVGGQVTAANTLMHHLSTLLRANKALNDAGMTYDQPYANKIVGTALHHGKGNAAVNDWKQATQFVSEEMAKLVKGGVATEGEVTAMLDRLDPSLSPEQRNAAIKQLAEFAQGRLSAIESHRDQVLGDMGNKIKILTPEAQRIYDATQRLNEANPPAQGEQPKQQAKYMRGQIIVHGGKKYRVVGGNPADPDLEEVR